MARVTGSYESVIRGVSQQVPHDRRSGQMGEQVNMISDPVRGLTRRRGSVYESSYVRTGNDDYDVLCREAGTFKEHTFFIGSEEFALLYRSGPTTQEAALMLCYNKTRRTAINVLYGTGEFVDKCRLNGLSALTSIGRYLYGVPNNHLLTARNTPLYEATWRRLDNRNLQHGAVWIRGGTYARTYSVTVRTTGGTYKASYTTPTSMYPGVLDTSDIPMDDPQYNQKVSQRQVAYQTAVNQWAASSAEAIQPENIAQQLVVALQAAAATAGIPGNPTARRHGSHIYIAPYVWSSNTQQLIDIEADDGGDGTAMWAVGNTVQSVDRLSPMHVVGSNYSKVVRVLPKNAREEDAFYMKAYPKSAGATGFVEVTWRECAHTESVAGEANSFLFCTVHNGNLYVTTSARMLSSATGLDVPGFEPRRVGDSNTAPLPSMFTEQITYLGSVQDRLLVVSGSSLFMSRTGDYLNWFRASVLTVEDTDPVEMFALGAEDDIVTAGVTYDRGLLLFGRRRQYLINGRNVITPKTASVVTMASYEDATDADPKSNGNYVFYTKSLGGFTSLHQIQTGVVAEAPETYEVSPHLDTYMRGEPRQILTVMSPNTVFVRTTGNTNGLYVYTYLDSPDGGQRLFDSWSRWEWNPALGRVVAMFAAGGDIIVVTLRKQGNSVFTVFDRFSLETAPWDRPYLDSQRPYAAASQQPTPLTGDVIQAEGAIAIGYGEHANAGVPAKRWKELVAKYPDATSRMYYGTLYSDQTKVTLTNPYLRDREGKPRIDARLTVLRLTPYVESSGGLSGIVSSLGQDGKETAYWPPRVVGQAITGDSPLASGSVTVPVGREVRDYTATLKPHTWKPLTITAVEWVGQLFINSRRI